MEVRTQSYVCAGYEKHNQIKIVYNFYGGKQKVIFWAGLHKQLLLKKQN